MQLGKVIGRVWATTKNDALQGQRLLVVQPCTPEGAASGDKIVCCDATRSAGAGELIYWVRGREASFALPSAEVPVDSTIVGIVDELLVNRSARGED